MTRLESSDQVTVCTSRSVVFRACRLPLISTAQDAPERVPPMMTPAPSGFQVRNEKASASLRSNTGTEPVRSAIATPRLDGFDSLVGWRESGVGSREWGVGPAAVARVKLPSARAATLPVTPVGAQIANCENW